MAHMLVAHMLVAYMPVAHIFLAAAVPHDEWRLAGSSGSALQGRGRCNVSGKRSEAREFSPPAPVMAFRPFAHHWYENSSKREMPAL